MKFLAYILILFTLPALADTYIEKSGNKTWLLRHQGSLLPILQR